MNLLAVTHFFLKILVVTNKKDPSKETGLMIGLPLGSVPLYSRLLILFKHIFSWFINHKISLLLILTFLIYRKNEHPYYKLPHYAFFALMKFTIYYHQIGYPTLISNILHFHFKKQYNNIYNFKMVTKIVYILILLFQF
jgi:hypothetical protein